MDYEPLQPEAIRNRSPRVLRRSSDTASTYQEVVGTLIVRMFWQLSGLQRLIELTMEREPLVLNVFPRHVTATDGQEPFAVLVYS